MGEEGCFVSRNMSDGWDDLECAMNMKRIGVRLSVEGLIHKYQGRFKSLCRPIFWAVGPTPHSRPSGCMPRV